MDLSKIQQLLTNLHETVVSNNHDNQKRLNSLEKLLSNGNDTKEKLISLEKKMQKLEDLFGRLCSGLNQQLNKANCDQESEKKEKMPQEVISTDSKVEELQDLVDRLLGQLNQKLNKPCCHQELKQKEKSLMKEIKQKVMSAEAKMQEVQDHVSRSLEKSKQLMKHLMKLINEANCDQELKLREEMLQEVMLLDENLLQENGMEMLNGTQGISQLVDKFLFGSKKEQMVIESLCLRWTIQHKDILIPKNGIHIRSSEVFPLNGYQLKAQIYLIINENGDVAHYLGIKEDESRGQKVGIKQSPLVTFIIKDVNGKNRHIIQNKYQAFDKSFQYNVLRYWSGFSKVLQWKESISSRDKSMEVLVLVEPYIIINKPLSVDGTITDNIEHCGRKLQMEKEGLFNGHWSPPFLTHASGYRVAVQMWLDMSINASMRGLVAQICFLSGEFDSQLGSEFEHETSITLINQINAKMNITATKQAKMADNYTMFIASSDKLNSRGFIISDSLKYHVTIKPMQ